MEGITVVAGLDDYLVTTLDATLTRAHARLTPDARAYVAFLLRNEARGRTDPTRPLAPQLADALQSRLPRRIRREKFRMVGDASLVLCGLWWMRHDRPQRAETLDFYLDAGPLAYRQLGEEPLFAELAHRFGMLVDVLVRMEMTGGSGTAGDIVRLFRLWERSHSTHAARILAERGVILTSPCGSTPS